MGGSRRGGAAGVAARFLTGSGSPAGGGGTPWQLTCRPRPPPPPLSGTPLQNDLAELQNLLHFLLPSVFAAQGFEDLADMLQVLAPPAQQPRRVAPRTAPRWLSDL